MGKDWPSYLMANLLLFDVTEHDYTGPPSALSRKDLPTELKSEK